MTAEELNKEVMKQLLIDALSEQVDKEHKSTPPEVKEEKEAISKKTETDNESATTEENEKIAQKEEINEGVDKKEEEKKEKKKIKPSSKRKKKSFLDKVKSGEKAKTLLVLVLALLVNTYAWFLYVSTVSTGLTMHVRNWLFEFSESEDHIVIQIDRVFPGMTTFTKEITGSNMGEMTADLKVSMDYARVMDDVYVIGGTYTKPDSTTGTYTSEDIISALQNNYPFKVNIYIDDVLYDGSEMILSSGDSKVVKYEVVWPYESTTDPDQLASYDAIDTQYGNLAYTYYNAHKNDTDVKTKDCIYISLLMQAVQDEGAPQTPEPPGGP